MAKSYKILIDDYSLNELTRKLAGVIYGDHVIASSEDVIPAFSNLVKADPDTKGVAWELDYKSQADNLANRLNMLLNVAK